MSFKNPLVEKNTSRCSIELFLENRYSNPVKRKKILLKNKTNRMQSYLWIGHELIYRSSLFQSGKSNSQIFPDELNSGIQFSYNKHEVRETNQNATEALYTFTKKSYWIKDTNNLWNTECKMTTKNNIPIFFSATPLIKTLQTGKVRFEIVIHRFTNQKEGCILFNYRPLSGSNKSVPFSVVPGISGMTLEKNYQAA